MLIATALSVGGCANFLTETNPEEPWSQSRYRELRHEDQKRLLGEDHTKSTAGEIITWVPRKMWSGVEWTWNVTTGHAPAKYAKELFHRNPDLRRRAIYVLSDERWGRRDPYTKYYGHMAVDDRDQTVRAAALRALNRSRDAAQANAYLSELSDPSEWVRLEAVKAIANIPDPKAVPALLRLLADEQQTRDIRIASADALRAYRQSDIAQALIRVLSDRDFGLAWQARRSLNLMTAQDFRYNQEAWLKYLTTSSKPFVS
jgi:hypothetical protein